MSDSEHILGTHYALDTDETTILTKGEARLRAAVFTGTLDADASTTVNLVGLPSNAVIVMVSMMVWDGVNEWCVSDYRCANDASTCFRFKINTTAAVNKVLAFEVGADFQGEPFRITVLYTEKL